MKKSRIIGFSLIILSWVFWGMIIIVPFLKLGIKTTAVVLTILFIASNIFWVGAILIGKELAQKYRVWPRIKSWLKPKS